MAKLAQSYKTKKKRVTSPIKIKTLYSTEDQITLELEFDPNKTYVAHINFVFPVVTKIFLGLLEFSLPIKKSHVYKIGFLLLEQLYLKWHLIKKNKSVKIIYLCDPDELSIRQGEWPEKKRLVAEFKVVKECPGSSPKYKESYDHLRNFNFMDSIGTIIKKDEKPWARFHEVYFGLKSN
jgi:hypothetical protein